MYLLEFIKSCVGTALSLIVILKLKLNKKKIGYFFISKKLNKNLIDNRSLIYLNEKKLKKGVSFVRSQNFITSIKIFAMYKNIILMNYIINFIEFIVLGNKNKKKIIFVFLNYIFKSLKLKEFHTIDDYRNIKLISDLCEYNYVKLNVYQHGRLSSSLGYQENLKNIKFEKYFVWSLFFKKKLIKFNSQYNNSNISIKKRFNFSFNKKKKTNKIKRILIIQENNIKYLKIIEIIRNLNKKKKYQLFFKFRPNSILDNDLKIFLEKNDIIFYHHENIYDLMKKNNFDFLLAFNSTLILESSYFNILPVLIYDKTPELRDYIKDKVFFTSNIKNLYTNLNKIYKKKNMITKIKKKLWN